MEAVSHDARHRYDRWSMWYDWLAAAGEKRIQMAGIDLLKTQAPASVLDLGCGTGTAMLRLYGQLQGVKVIGVDISGGMLHKAASKLSSCESGGRVRLVQGDAIHVPLRDHQIDAVFLSFTLELFSDEDIPAVLGEVGRVCRKDGCVLLVSMADSRQETLVLRIYRWLHARFPDWIDCRPIHLEDYLRSEGFYVQQTERHQIAGLPVDVMLATMD